MLARLFFVHHGAQLAIVSSEVAKLKEKKKFLVKNKTKRFFQKRFYQENVEATFLMSRCHLGLTINHRAKTISESADARSRSTSFVFLTVISPGILLK